MKETSKSKKKFIEFLKPSPMPNIHVVDRVSSNESRHDSITQTNEELSKSYQGSTDRLQKGKQLGLKGDSITKEHKEAST